MRGRVDTEFASLAAHELHAGKHVLHRLREHLSFGRQPVADGEHRNAARGKIRPPVLERGARALDPAAAMHGDQRRCCFRAFRQKKIAHELDAVMIGVSDAGVGDDTVVGHFFLPVIGAGLSRLDLASGVNRPAHAGHASQACRIARRSCDGKVHITW